MVKKHDKNFYSVILILQPEAQKAYGFDADTTTKTIGNTTNTATTTNTTTITEKETCRGKAAECVNETLSGALEAASDDASSREGVSQKCPH